MLHQFIGPAALPAFWDAVAALRGRVLSASGATFVLRCSYEALHRLIEDGELEAWAYLPEAGVRPQHSMVSVPSLVRHGIRAGIFRTARDRDLGALNVSGEEFAALWEEEFGA
jgi:hypothetical protein